MKTLRTKEDMLALKNGDTVLVKRETIFEVYTIKIPYDKYTKVAILHKQSGGIGSSSLEDLYNTLVRCNRI